MVIAGKIRGNATQLADYLLAQGENERITIMDVDGQDNADAAYLKDMLYSMQLNSELTRSPNSVYHAYINPNPEDTTDRAMTMEEWHKSVEILTKQLGYEDQRRVVVLHEKPGKRTHAHIVFERYNHERGVMATYEHNYNAHDKARAEIEKELDHKPTPQKNKNRNRHKQTLTQIWQRTNTAKEFMREATASGYKIAKGTDRPFRVVDADGVSFNLLRKLDGIKTREVKERFGEMELMTDKEAIRQAQWAKQAVEVAARQAEQPNIGQKPVQQQNQVANEEARPESVAEPKQPVPPSDEREEMRRKFLAQIKEVRENNRNLGYEIGLYMLIMLRVSFSFQGHAPKEIKLEKKSLLTEQFAGNAFDITAPEEPPNNILNYRQSSQIYKPT